MNHPSQIEKHENKENFERLEEFNNYLFYQHNVYEYAFKGNVGAPVYEKLQNGAKVLEFGCASGIWTTEVASEYPNTEFYAVDFIIPDSSANDNNNITFIKCDILKKLPFPDNEFDYVFSRDKYIFFKNDNIQNFVLEIFRVLKPGGWLEVVYPCFYKGLPGSALSRIFDGVRSLYMSYYIDYRFFMTNFETYLQNTGKAENISHQIAKIPLISDHAFAEFTCENCLLFFKTLKGLVAPIMKISFEEFDDLINNSENELKTPNEEM
ncbi:387_t:CDS:2, partial [Cetraspora pellucida]